jgi:hypothetical protein
VRAAYLAMEMTGWFVIVPLSFASLLTGLVQSLGTPWGLFRHYWVLIKLLITILATILLLVHMRPTTYLAKVAAADGIVRSGSPSDEDSTGGRRWRRSAGIARSYDIVVVQAAGLDWLRMA